MTASTKYDQYIERQRRTYGEKFSPGGLDPRFVPYYNSGDRVRVRTVYKGTNGRPDEVHERTGTIGATSGWGPVFLLMRQRRSVGSSDTLGTRDQIIAVQRGRVYVSI